MRESLMRYSLPFLRRERMYPLLDGHSTKTRDQDYSLPKLDAKANDDSEEIPVVQKTPRAKEVPSTSVTGTNRIHFQC